jgi:pimeloyl-ACP methyl ester carboxylesterase
MAQGYRAHQTAGRVQDGTVSSQLTHRGGTGQPLVLVHGLMGRGSTWSRQWPWLAGLGSVYTYDAPWHREVGNRSEDIVIRLYKDSKDATPDICLASGVINLSQATQQSWKKFPKEVILIPT